jgi:two-component system, NtrC family, response regulator GlrR
MRPLAQRKLLVVEDADTCANMIELALDGLPGLQVERVASAEAGLDVLSGSNVVAIVTDMDLPGMSGLELATCARHVPVVVVSATTDPDAEAKAIAAGASAFFAKPFSPSAIRRKMEELLKE